MAFKIRVEDRVPTYPGRITLTPVSGSDGTYDMVRADMPIAEGTPINKALFDHKADALVEDVTVYVTSTGSDLDGDGTLDSPFKTIQAAIDALPKNLNGYTATVDVEIGTYNENVVCRGFIGGKLIVGLNNRLVTIQSIEFDNCTFAVMNINRITAPSGATFTPLKVTNGSHVHLNRSIIIDGASSAVSGLSATYNSSVSSINGVTITSNNCGGSAIVATNGSTVALYTIAGSNNFAGMYASVGGVITYETGSIESFLGDESSGGGRIWTGGSTSVLSVASVEE